MYPIETQDGLFHDGDGVSELGTILPAWWLNQIQAEITAVLLAAGITPAKASQAQLLAAIKSIVGAQNLPVGGTYSATHQYQPGDLLKVDGDWYECYHPNGCLGKDPRDAANRPSGWTETDTSKPYHWLKIGPWLSLPETGSPIYLPGTTLREGLIKYRNDGGLHKSKFWRLAQLYPSLVNGNYIQIADLRGEFLRGLDDDRGVDAARGINTAQGDAIRNIVGETAGNNFGAWRDQTGNGVFENRKMYSNNSVQANSSVPGTDQQMYNRFDASKVVPTASENRPRNIAMVCATRI